MSKLNIVFMGTPQFAVPSLIAINEKYGIKAVVTATDKPKGRGHILLPSEVKIKALELGIPILQPDSLKSEEFLCQLDELSPDIIVVVAFRILPKEVYTKPKIGCFNIHGSLLPKYRGAAPINHAIIEGEKITGLTSFLLQEKVDTGDVLLQQAIPIPSNATASDLHDLLMPISSRLAIDTFELLISGNYKPLPQNNDETTPAPKLFTENAKINYSQSAERVKNFIHGYSSIPGAWSIWNSKKVKFFRADFQQCQCDATEMMREKLINSGDYLIEDGKFIVKCSHGYLFVNQLQIEGKKALNIADFLRGYKGKLFGSFN